MNYTDLVLRESTLFENYQSQGYSDYLTALKLADEVITQRILATNGEWTKAKLNEVKRTINEEIGKAYGGLFEAIQDESVESASIVYGAVVGSMASKLPKTVVEDIINSNRDIQGYTFKELFKISEDNQARQLRVIVASGVSQGLSVDKIIKNYNIKSDKLSKGQIAGNIFTTVTDSRDYGRYQGYRELEKMGIIKGYEYNAVLDSGTTQYCRQHDSNIYFKPIDEISHLMHTHFRCRSQFIPYNKDAKQRASQTGATELNFEDWFLSQDNNFHKATLENKKYKAFLQGKYKVENLTDITKKQSLNSIRKSLLDFI